MAQTANIVTKDQVYEALKDVYDPENPRQRRRPWPHLRCRC